VTHVATAVTGDHEGSISRRIRLPSSLSERGAVRERPPVFARDVTDRVAEAVSESALKSGIAYLWPPPGPFLVRLGGPEVAIAAVELLLERLSPGQAHNPGLLFHSLLGPHGERVPFADRRLLLGSSQRILLLGIGRRPDTACTLTLI
jgi:hypothetical protein